MMPEVGPDHRIRWKIADNKLGKGAGGMSSSGCVVGRYER